MRLVGLNSHPKSSQRSMPESIERVVASGLVGEGVTRTNVDLVNPEATKIALLPSKIGSRLVGWA